MSRAFHVTERETAALILEEGFLGGWGDVGFGVYFWSEQQVARAYLEHGGWDGPFEDPVILEVTDPSLVPIDAFLIHPEWDPDLYSAMLWRPMDEEEPDTPWRPAQLSLLEGPASGPEPGT